MSMGLLSLNYQSTKQHSMIRKRAEIKGEGIVDLAGLVMKTEIFWYDIWRRKKTPGSF